MIKKKCKVVYTELFRTDIKNVFNYIVNELDNPIAAERLMELIKEKIEERVKYPESFSVVKISKNKNRKWYRINVKNYVIFYTVENDIIAMRRFLYSRRNYKNFI